MKIFLFLQYVQLVEHVHDFRCGWSRRQRCESFDIAKKYGYLFKVLRFWPDALTQLMGPMRWNKFIQ